MRLEPAQVTKQRSASLRVLHRARFAVTRFTAVGKFMAVEQAVGMIQCSEKSSIQIVQVEMLRSHLKLCRVVLLPRWTISSKRAYADILLVNMAKINEGKRQTAGTLDFVRDLPLATSWSFLLYNDCWTDMPCLRRVLE